VEGISGRVQASEHDAAAARVLAGAADRDVSAIQGELRDFRTATNASFNALRQDFVDLREHVDRGFAQVDQGFTEVRGKLDGTAAGQERVVELLQTLIDKP
jgi:ABC-type transporter Mla subunit MlaD